ncbi:MAG: restriction endonuclease subunit S [Pseudomonadota bacterium]
MTSQHFRTVAELENIGEASLQTGPFGTQLKASEYVDEGVPVINVRNIGFGDVRKEDLEYLNEAKAEKLHQHRLRKGDIVFGRKGAVERHALIDESVNGWIQGSDCLRLRIKSKDVSERYLSHYLKTQAHQDWMQALCSFGATMSSLNQDIVRRISFPAPPIEVQRRIAAILSAYDELIENNQRRIGLLEKMAEQIYREWFVRLRFPGHEKVKKVKGVPVGWELVKLENAFKYTGGGTPTKEVSRYWDGGDVNWFTPSDITGADGIFLERSGEQCTEEGFNNSSAKIFPAYSVMLTSRATIGAVGINLTPACTNQGFITCIPNARYPLPYLYHWIKLAKPHFELLSGGATFAELTKGTFKKIEILTPPVMLVEKFDELETPIFKAIEMFQRQNARLIATRNRLLPRLISGKLSVENLDIHFPPSMEETAHEV